MDLLPGPLILAYSVFILVLPNSSALVAEEISFISARSKYLIFSARYFQASFARKQLIY